MRCSSCEQHLDRYVEGTLAARQMLAMASHLQRCDSCTTLMQELRVIDALLATTQPVELPPNFSFAVMAEVRGITVHQPRRVPIWALVFVYLVGAWTVIAGSYAIFGTRAPLVANSAGALLSVAREGLATISGIAHDLGASSPLVVASVFAVLLIDAMLAGCLIFYRRSIHPRLAAALNRSEAS